MNDHQAHQRQQLETIRQLNEKARMRQFMQPGKGYRVNFWRRMVRRVLGVLT